MIIRGKKLIGIIGGMGPKAGLELGNKIIEETQASCDQEHVPFVLFSIPQVNDRTSYILDKEGSNPAESISTFVQEMAFLGVSDVGIACNTCHAPQILSRLRENIQATNVSINLHSIVDTTLDHLKRISGDRLRVGVLSTLGCKRVGMYENALIEQGIECIQFAESELTELVHESIYNREWGIKSCYNGISNEVAARLNQAVEILKSNGATHVILGCSEIPLALAKLDEREVKFIDPVRCLARSLIRAVSPSQLREMTAEAKNSPNESVGIFDQEFLVTMPASNNRRANISASPQE